jgi:uncharacterized protein YodC (DUF2158 family)
MLAMRLTSRFARRPKPAAKPTYRAGEGLKLKSGGHPMTAIWRGPVLFAPGNWLICQWFSDAGEQQQEMFAEETLERASNALAA